MLIRTLLSLQNASLYVISLDLDHPAMKSREDLQVALEGKRQAKCLNNQGEN